MLVSVCFLRPSLLPRAEKQRSAHCCVWLWRQSKAKFPGRQLVYVSRNWGFTVFPKDVFMEGRQMTQEGKIDWKGASGIIKADGVGTKFASKKSVRLSKMGIWHKSSGDIQDRPSDAMRLNWGL